MRIAFKAHPTDAYKIKSVLMMVLQQLCIDSQNIEYIAIYGGQGYGWDLDVYNDDDGDIVYDFDIDWCHIDKLIALIEKAAKNPLIMKAISKNLNKG